MIFAQILETFYGMSELCVQCFCTKVTSLNLQRGNLQTCKQPALIISRSYVQSKKKHQNKKLCAG